MGSQEKDRFAVKTETTPLLGDDLENAYGSTPTTEKKPQQQTLWEWTKAEAACYSKALGCLVPSIRYSSYLSLGTDQTKIISCTWCNSQSLSIGVLSLLLALLVWEL